MTGNINTSAGEPRVFISYARADGEKYAQSLRRRLEKVQIPLWQDRVSLEGGRDWWLQIEEALDHVEFMVMVMTPAALQSPIVRKEWRTARQKGVCVYPVKAHPNIDFANLPRWMRDIHWYDPEKEWTKFVNDLNTRCEQKRVPFMVEELPDDFVERPEESEALINLLLDTQREEPVAITAALRGAGGYGKTTMARAICHNERIQEAFDDGILWVTLSETPGNLVAKLEDLIYVLSRERPGFSSLDAATVHLAELLADRDILLVIDDVWNGAHLKPFLQGGDRCARLVTTRDEGVLPRIVQRIQVDAMLQHQAVQLLSAGLDTAPRSTNETKELRQLAARLGEWPLLLTLVNSALGERVDRGQPLHDALNSINKILDRRGLTAFDAQNAHERNQAVAKTLDMSIEMLSDNDRIRYKELAIFPEDVDIPLVTVQKLWGATGGLDDIDTEDTCERLYRLSLLLRYDLATRTIRLHDVVRTYLRQNVGKEWLQVFHNQLLDVYGCKVWSELPHDEPYMWDHLAVHLLGAGRGEELIATVKDGRYLVVKIFTRSVYALEVDLNIAEQLASTDTTLRLLKRNVTRISHILAHCQTQSEVAVVLYIRLMHLQELSDVCTALEHELPRPYLIPWHPLPDLEHSGLIRTLQGHTGSVNSCAISPAGDFIVSASADHTLKVWDTHSGLERLTLNGHTDSVNSCAISPAGDFIVSASDDQTLKLWDAYTGAERLTLTGHSNIVNGCAISPTGDFIVSASWDSTLKIWDALSGAERITLTGHTDWVRGCAISPAGDFIVSASHDKTIKVWDAFSGTERLTLTGHTLSVYGCSVSPAGDFIVSASADFMLKVWNAHSSIERLTLSGHTDTVYGCAVSPAGDFIVSASSDGMFKVWDVYTGTCLSTLPLGRWLLTCEFCPDSKHLVVGGEGGVYFLQLIL